MLAIRLQRVGRKAYPTYRIIVQDAHRHPSSGKIVAQVGSLNPHTKTVTLDQEAIKRYLDNGAQPTTRVVRLLQDAKMKLPKWVVLPETDAKKSIRKPEKLRRNRPKVDPKAEAAEDATGAAEAAPVEPSIEVAPIETTAEDLVEKTAEEAAETKEAA